MFVEVWICCGIVLLLYRCCGKMHDEYAVFVVVKTRCCWWQNNGRFGYRVDQIIWHPNKRSFRIFGGGVCEIQRADRKKEQQMYTKVCLFWLLGQTLYSDMPSVTIQTIYETLTMLMSHFDAYTRPTEEVHSPILV